MFYQLDEAGALIAATRVFGPDWELLPEDCESYAYPVAGWHWFDTEAEARAFFGLPEVESVEEPA